MRNKQQSKQKFARLMEEYIQAEGSYLLLQNQALRANPAAAVPEAVERHAMEVLREALAQRSQTPVQVKKKKSIRFIR